MRSRRTERLSMTPGDIDIEEKKDHMPNNDVSSFHTATKDNTRATGISLFLRRQRNASLVTLCIVLFIVNLWQWQRRQAPRSVTHFSTWTMSKILQQPPSSSSSSSSISSSECLIDLGNYRGPHYHSVESGTIGQPQCLLTSKWISVSLHTVQFPGSNNNTIYNDWMWIDYHDRINVLVEDERLPSDGERRFLVFEQTKYALEGKTSWAIIGGIIEPGEEPEMAARREVQEEMNGLECENFHFLGRYRTDVNRGMGWLNSFLATNCSRKRSKHQPDHVAIDEVGAADTEKQTLKSVSLTEIKQAAKDGKFMEVQWTATVAQALLHPELSANDAK